MSLTLTETQPSAVAMTETEVASQIAEALRHPAVDAFHHLWYRAPFTWPMTRYCGVPILKCPLDLQVYHDLCWAIRPKLVIETGTCFGGSALWFADQLEPWGGQVLSIDVRSLEDAWTDIPAQDHTRVRSLDHPRITYLTGDSVNPAVVAVARQKAAQARGPVLVSLDSDHRQAHVAAELAVYPDFVTMGSYCVVEDTNVSGRPLTSDDPGPGAAVDAFLAETDRFVPNALCERFLLTFHPGGWLARVR